MGKVFLGLIVLVFTTGIKNPVFGQAGNNTESVSKEKFYLDLYLGTQVSGIRKVDHVASNFSPYIQVSAGRWFTPYMALALNYQGPYFNYISDDIKHKYVYLGGNAVLNLNSLLTENHEGLWGIHGFGGLGALYNEFYKKTNFCLNTGLINELKVKNNWSLKLKVSAIMGWSIYQEDKDILLNISVGISKIF